MSHVLPFIELYKDECHVVPSFAVLTGGKENSQCQIIQCMDKNYHEDI